MRNAENEVKQTQSKILKPIHFLIACLNEKTGALGEVSLKCSLDVTSLRAQTEDNQFISNQNLSKSPLFNVTVAEEITEVFDVAISIMKRYNQIYLNEGHVLEALIRTHFIDKFVTDHDKEIILTLGTTAQDMITHLGDYTFPKVNSDIVRRVKQSDSAKLEKYVAHNFSYEWSQTLKGGFQSRNPSYI